MRYLVKKIYFILSIIVLLFFCTISFSKDNKDKYSQKNISNYFSGIVSSKQDNTKVAYKHLNKVKLLKNSHDNFNVEFIRTLVLLGKFEEAFKFSKDIWLENKFFFEVDLLLGLDTFINKDYSKSIKHFERLKQTPGQNLFIDNFLGNILLSWTKAAENNKKDSFYFVNEISDRYKNLKAIQNCLLLCYFDSYDTQDNFEKLIKDEEYNFSRYNFFLVNYLVSKNKINEAKKVISEARIDNNSNLLIKQTENFILNGNSKKIKNLFNCKDPKNSIAEIFYVLANLYSSQKDYQLSNFYLNVALFFNNKFIPNKTLLAENFYYQKKYDLSKDSYNSLKSIGPVYSWYATKNIAIILSNTEGEKYSASNLEKEFNLLTNPDFQQYYELANHYKDYSNHEKSIKYYSLALEKIEKDHLLIPEILERRGTSYERIGKWEQAEKDLIESLRIKPDQPYTLNYLAYSWVEKRININKALDMLVRANKLRENDGYIIDSLGWAHFVNNNFIEAEKFLQRAVELMPLDPVINDHYADALWMLNKNIQARYLWKNVLKLESTEKKLRDDVSKKLIFGINKNL